MGGRVLWVGSVCCVLLAACSCSANGRVAVEGQEETEAPAALPDPGRLQATLFAAARERIGEDRLVRADGYVYAIDVALLTLAFALAADRPSYQRLVELARVHFLIEQPPGLDAPVILWRRRVPHDPPDASGTTEALRFAQAWLLGSETFERPGDARLARRVLRGYLLHAGKVSGTWMVRNYYNLDTRTFATNSYFIDYAPDLLAFAGSMPRDAALLGVAAKSVALIRQARRPNGLVDVMLQPEIRTLYPFAIFSPNDIIQLEHAAIVAEQVVKNAPEVGRGLLGFAGARLPDLPASVQGRSGRAFGEESADAGTLAALVRLAVRLDDADAVKALQRPFLENADWVAREVGRPPPESPETHVLAQTLLGLFLLERFEAGLSLPDALAGRALPGQTARGRRPTPAAR